MRYRVESQQKCAAEERSCSWFVLHIRNTPADLLDEVNGLQAQVPDVSIATGIKSTLVVMSAYFSCFDASAADPARVLLA
jgi:hypothetical protein